MIFEKKTIINLLMIIFLLIIPFLEIYITEKNRVEEATCDYILNISIVDWSVIKNTITVILTFIILLFLSLNKYVSLRHNTKKIIYIWNILLILWLMIGIDLIFRHCSLNLSSDIVTFNIVNILMGIISVVISFYVVFESIKYNEVPLLDVYEYSGI